ncbi:hypothetical protein RU08_14800 [Pseudomonas fulva]|uniref:Uncharacterized protein n=1 Tax=Pseudomonas fulva TaxID=47880 RepID=A0A0D0IZT9_9PSED|nr:hypothetical protein RU08_14800 [Pseudomonas fulva]
MLGQALLLLQLALNVCITLGIETEPLVQPLGLPVKLRHLLSNTIKKTFKFKQTRCISIKS